MRISTKGQFVGIFNKVPVTIPVWVKVGLQHFGLTIATILGIITRF